jgi:hypothetical protein
MNDAAIGEIAIVGLVRNGEATVGPAVRRIAAALPERCRAHWMVIESDSDDGTTAALERLRQEIPGFDFRGLGRLAERHPKRTDRIAQCRNAGLDWFEALRARGEPLSHLLMVDLDGVNDGLTRAALASCWQRSDWDACMANQAGRYYDLWALRHPAWCPGDCWAEADFLSAHGVPRDRATMAAVYLRMLVIPPEHDWIAVDSAFGGLAVYRAEAIAGLRYQGLTPEGAELCEHVALHAAMRGRGARLFINPRLINGSAGDSETYFPGPAAALRRAGSWRLRAALWLAFGRREGKALRRLIEGMR